MVALTKSNLAEEDLINIWLFIAADDPVAADAHLDKLDQSFHHLLAFPETGTEKPEFKSH